MREKKGFRCHFSHPFVFHPLPLALIDANFVLPFSVPLSLNRKITVYALKGQHPVVVKYLPLTKFGHSELHYTRVFSGELYGYGR